MLNLQYVKKDFTCIRFARCMCEMSKETLHVEGLHVGEKGIIKHFPETRYSQ